MDYLLPSSIGVIIIYLIISFLIKTNSELTKEDKSIKGSNFTMRDETFEEKNDPIKKLLEEAEKVDRFLKK